MTTALLQTTYFGPVQWYQKLHRYDRCLIDGDEPYRKQSYRNRCIIAAPNGPQALTVPVEHNGPHSTLHAPLVRDIRISDHNAWRRVHWNALQTAYSESPFFDYYADDIRPFFEQKFTYLLDFNEAICWTMCELLDIPAPNPKEEPTPNLIPQEEPTPIPSRREGGLATTSAETNQTPLPSGGDGGGFLPMGGDGDGIGLRDFRSVISAKHPQADPEFVPRRYWQVFGHKLGFLPNLSILDLLFCMGPEAILYL
ncbi:MAG: WbqC family protein [Prevotella sp.]|nr:WbqC family protein [Prevotella sp.]